MHNKQEVVLLILQYQLALQTARQGKNQRYRFLVTNAFFYSVVYLTSPELK